MTEHDAEATRRLIQRVDPAQSLAALRNDQLMRLTEDAMTRTDPQTGVAAAAPRTSRLRRGLIIGGLAAAVVGIAVVVAVPLLTGPKQAPTVLALPPGGTTAKCAEVTPESIAQYSDTAFRADVTEISDGTVTLAVTERFTGEVADTVEVTQGAEGGMDGAPMVFESDQTYLIGAADGTVLSCGISGVADPALEALYAEAFGG